MSICLLHVNTKQHACLQVNCGILLLISGAYPVGALGDPAPGVTKGASKKEEKGKGKKREKKQKRGKERAKERRGQKREKIER